ncbi:hypothetical protein GlitD10_0560 [Gloeomargarita lithophora Alchichica-D10]|uniref:Uncharacterized protein n=1 Tax=Gloeomargarita lithophora Alchichica-D10 TaxID=1188229 RepID=A0A1J0AAC0_9CYAN|nr:hypothetical protein GlitD10_0560 [Gloeomargarita lithophora Alchichica-D10]
MNLEQRSQGHRPRNWFCGISVCKSCHIAIHKVKGVKQAIYRADIDKISGWRIHVQYINGQLHLKDIIEGKRHDDVLEVIKSKKIRYE